MMAFASCCLAVARCKCFESRMRLCFLFASASNQVRLHFCFTSNQHPLINKVHSFCIFFSLFFPLFFFPLIISCCICSLFFLIIIVPPFFLNFIRFVCRFTMHVLTLYIHSAASARDGAHLVLTELQQHPIWGPCWGNVSRLFITLMPSSYNRM